MPTFSVILPISSQNTTYKSDPPIPHRNDLPPVQILHWTLSNRHSLLILSVQIYLSMISLNRSAATVLLLIQNVSVIFIIWSFRLSISDSFFSF